MNLKAYKNGPIVNFYIDGRFDSYAVPKVEEAFNHLLSVHIPPFILVHLDQVTFLDSSALAILVKVSKRCEERHGKIGLIGIQPTVIGIFRETRLDRAFEIYQSETEAQMKLTVKKTGFGVW